MGDTRLVEIQLEHIAGHLKSISESLVILAKGIECLAHPKQNMALPFVSGFNIVPNPALDAAIESLEHKNPLHRTQELNFMFECNKDVIKINEEKA